MKSVLDLLEAWEKQSDRVFGLVAGLATLLLVASVSSRSRPTDVLATLAEALGLWPIARYFTSDLPPILELEDTALHVALTTSAGLLCAWMVTAFCFRTWGKHEIELNRATNDLISSRAPQSFWLLLCVASQYGHVTDTVGPTGARILDAFSWTVIGLIALGLIALFRDTRAGRLARLLLRGLGRLAPLGLALIMTLAALLIAGLSFPISVIAWVTSTAPSREARPASRLQSSH